MNTFFNKVISIAVLSMLTLTLALPARAGEPAGASEPGMAGKIFQKIEAIFSSDKGQMNVQPAGQQPVGQNQPLGQGQLGGQGQAGQPTGQKGQQSGQGQFGQPIFGQPGNVQPSGQNQPKGQGQFGQPSGQQPQGQGQFGAQGQMGQSLGQPSTGQNTPKGQSSGQQQQSMGQNQSGSQQPVGQNQPLGQGQLGGQGQAGQPTGQKSQQSGQGQFGQPIFGQPGNVQPSGQNQPKGQGQFGQPSGQQPLGQGQFGGQGQFNQLAGQQQQPIGTDKNVGAGEPSDNVSPVPENVSSYGDNLQLHEQERREALAEKYAEMKEEYNETLKKHEDARKHFLEFRQQFSAVNPANRERIQEKMNEQAQKYLQNTVETMTQRVEMLERRVLNMPMIPVLGKDKIVSGLNDDIAQLKEKLSEAEEAKDAGAIKDAAQSIREYWQEHDLKVKQVVGYTILGNVDKMTGKIENMAATLDKRVDELKAKGADVSKIEGYMAEYQKLMDLVEDKRAEAETQFNSVASKVVSATDAFHNGMKAVQDMKKLFIDVRDEMKNAVQGIKTLTNFEVASPAPEEEKALEDGEKNAE
jgi:hypothetical protein